MKYQIKANWWANLRLNHRWWWGLFLVAALMAVYWPALQGGFVWDDESWTTDIFRLLQGFSGLRMMWFHLTALQQYYPLSGTTFWLDYQLWEFWTTPYHVENILLHALATLLFWRLLLRLQLSGAWLAAALFALHPVMVESAAWITERKNVLSLAFYLGALLAYGRFTRFWQEDNHVPPITHDSSNQNWFAYALAFFLFLGALLAKTTAFSLPAVILLIGWWQHGRLRWRRDVVPTLPFFALAIGLCTVVAWLEKNHVGAQGRDFALTFPQRCLIAGHAFWFYLGKLLWPVNLCFVYPRWQPDPGVWWQWLCPVTAVGTLWVLWLARGRIGRGPITALCFFVGTLFPALGFLNVYFMRYSFVCDHWVYLSSLGLLALVAALVTRAAEFLCRPAMIYGFAVIVLPILGILTWRQAGMYAGMETFWRTVIAKNPDCWLAYNNLGDWLVKQGQLDEAIQHYQKAIQINPDDVPALYNLGQGLAIQGRLDEAIKYYQKVVQINPDDTDAHYNLGVVLGLQGRTNEAIAHYQTASQLKPDYAEAHNNLGYLLAGQHKLDEAIEHYQKAVQFKPDYFNAHYNLAKSLALQGRLDEAVKHYRAAIELKPDYVDAHGNLANVLVGQGKLDAAVEEYQRTLELEPNSAQAHFRFGQVLETQRNFKAAIAEYQKTLDLDPRHVPAHLGLAWLLATSPDNSLRNGEKAVALAEQARVLAGTESPQLLDTLAAAYAEAGQFAEAVATAKRALALPATQNNQPLAEAIQTRLKLYEANSPFHAKP